MSVRNKQVIIEIDDKGNCSVEGEGFSGSECSNLIIEINKALGVEISTQKKKEYNQRQAINNRQKIGR